MRGMDKVGLRMIRTYRDRLFEMFYNWFLEANKILGNECSYNAGEFDGLKASERRIKCLIYVRRTSLVV